MFTIFSKNNIAYAILFCLSIFSSKLPAAETLDVNIGQYAEKLEKFYNELKSKNNLDFNNLNLIYGVGDFVAVLKEANEAFKKYENANLSPKQDSNRNILKLFLDHIKESFDKGQTDIKILNDYSKDLKTSCPNLISPFLKWRNQKFDFFEFLLNPNVFANPEWENTVLMVAANSGCTELVKLLLIFGAKPNLKTSNRAPEGFKNLTALDFAEKGNHQAIVNILKPITKK